MIQVIYPWIQVASSYRTWCTEDARKGEANGNTSKAIDWMLKGVGLEPGNPWCAALVHHCGYHSLCDPVLEQSIWPAPATGGCQPLGAWGEHQGISFVTPQEGDIFLLYRAGPTFNRFAHTGFVTRVNADGSYHTIEGNTNAGGSRDGYGVFARVRRPADHGRDRFLRVANLIHGA